MQPTKIETNYVESQVAGLCKFSGQTYATAHGAIQMLILIDIYLIQKTQRFTKFQFTTFYAPEKWRPSSNVYSVPPQNMACILESSDGNIIQNRSQKQGHSMTKYTKPNNIEILNDGNPFQAYVTNNRKR